MNMTEYIRINTSRDTYSEKDAVERTISVGELIDYLERVSYGDMGMKVAFYNDNGYTLGYINEDSVSFGTFNEEDE